MAGPCRQWQVSVGDAGLPGAPAITRRRVYFGTADGLVALEADDGTVAWTAATAAPVRRRPVVAAASGPVAAVDQDGAVYLWDRHGDLDWRRPMDVTPVAAPQLLDGRIIVVAGQQRVVALSTAGGIAWERPSSQPATATATTRDAGLVLSANPGGLRAFDTGGGQQWSRPDLPASRLQPIPGAGLVVAGGSYGQLTAVETDTGRTAWRTDGNVQWRTVSIAPAAGGLVIDHGSRVEVLDAATGRQVSERDDIAGRVTDVGPQGWWWTVDGETVRAVDPAGDGTAWSASFDASVAAPPAVGYLANAGLAVVPTSHGSLAGLQPPDRHAAPTELEPLGDGQPCPTSPLAGRPHGPVLTGRYVEIRGLGTVGGRDRRPATLVYDRDLPADPTLTLTGRRLDGPGRMAFQFDPRSETTRQVELDTDNQRVAALPHWAVGARISQPGCWAYRIEGDGLTDVLVFETTTGRQPPTGSRRPPGAVQPRELVRPLQH